MLDCRGEATKGKGMNRIKPQFETMVGAFMVLGSVATAEASPDAAGELTSPTVDTAELRARAQEYPYESGGILGLGFVPGLRFSGGEGLDPIAVAAGSEVEVGYLLPPLRRSIEVFARGQYLQSEGDGPGAQNANGYAAPTQHADEVAHEVTVNQGILSLGGLYRIPLDLASMRPYFTLGGRVHLTKSSVEFRAADAELDEITETDTELGFFSAVGGEAFLGPGALLIELQLVYAKRDAAAFREIDPGALDLSLGYRLFP